MKLAVTSVIWCLLQLWALSASEAADTVVVDSGIGTIVGEVTQVKLRDGSQYNVNRFLGIPYAEAPVGDLRFAKPQPKKKFDGKFEALKIGPACPQEDPKGNVMSEDCLNLNIFVPGNNVPVVQKREIKELLPVVFWIHGGDFRKGEGRRSPVQYLSAFGNIIIVTFNYRLGALGFLSTGDSKAPGNFGLWDQRLALQWVRDNIGSFGGDPTRITMMGASTGGVSATFHAMYPPNGGLFQRLFAASGNALTVASYHTKAKKYAEKLAGELQCPASASENSETLLQCLRSKDFKDIVAADVSGAVKGMFDLAWLPTVDNDYIKENPLESVTWPVNENTPLSPLKDLDAMFGLCSADGSQHVWKWLSAIAKEENIDLKAGPTLELFHRTIDGLLESKGQNPSQLAREAVRYEYTPWGDEDNRTSLGASTIDVTTDKDFYIPNVLFAKNHAFENSKTQAYFFYFNEPKNRTKSYPWIEGTAHGRFNAYALGMPAERWKPEVDLDQESHRKLWELSKAVMTYWSNFVKTGDPNVPEPVAEEWFPYTVDGEEYMYMDAQEISWGSRLNARRTHFWLDFYPQTNE